MLKKEDMIEINKNFSTGEIEKIDVLNYSILKINNSENWIEKSSLLLKCLLSENCFKDGNKETAITMMLAALELNNIPINQDKLLNLVITISKNNVKDLRRIKRLIKEAI